MADYFFDTSALVKRHVTEIGTAWVSSIVRAKAWHTLYIARITAVEIASAITRRQRSGDLSVAQGGGILAHFRRHLAQHYRVVELTPSLFDKPMLAVRKHRLRAYDAVQLAVVLDVHRRQEVAGLGPATLVSADRDLNKAAQAKWLAVEDPNLHP